jgi:GrpB-like predicted nucleotidyltransferase (UPF0157 family)
VTWLTLTWQSRHDKGLGTCGRHTRTDAVAFNKASAAQHPHHLHLTVPGIDLWRERLAFRDALRHDPVLVVEYTELKARLLSQSGGRPYSATGKRFRSASPCQRVRGPQRRPPR